VLQSLRSIREMPRAAVLAVLALALLTRLAVPAGWMPVTDAHGARLTICTGMGAIDVPEHAMPKMTGMHHAPGDQKQDHGDHVCPFTGVAMALAAPILPALAVPPITVTETTSRQHSAVSVGRGLAAPPPPATGPPSLT